MASRAVVRLMQLHQALSHRWPWVGPHGHIPLAAHPLISGVKGHMPPNSFEAVAVPALLYSTHQFIDRDKVHGLTKLSGAHAPLLPADQVSAMLKWGTLLRLLA